MRTLHLYYDRQAGAFIQSLQSANPVTKLSFTQGDEYEIIVHNAVRNTAPVALTPHVERPLEFVSMRASFGRIDAPPKRGTFKFRIEATNETTAALTWPSSLATPAELATWKQLALDALKALASVGPAGITLDDPEGTPANIFWLTWTNPARTDEITVVENRLLPFTEVSRVGSVTPFGYTQEVKLAQYPVAISNNFTRPMPPPVQVIESRPGSVGTNAEQTVIIPAGATGSFSLAHGGATTKTMAVATVTATSLAAALNEIVTDGASNPSFRVEARATTSGRRFAVEFVGPLAGAPQLLLTPLMYDQEASMWARGTLDLELFKLPVELALNGQPSVELEFELVIDAPGEETVIVDMALLNDMTSGETLDNAENDGAILIIEKTVYIDSEGLPYVEASPGFVYALPAAALSFAITHGLNTRQPFVRVSYQYSTAPERWRDLAENAEFMAESTSLNDVLITFATALSAAPGDANYFGRYKIFIASPDGRIVAFTHQHTWDEVRQSLPGGLTVAAKFAAIDAAIGVFGGALNVPAANITGQISANQIDLTNLIQSFLTQTAFQTALTEQLKETITNVDVLSTMLEKLSTMETFREFLRTELLEIFSSDPTGIATFFRKIPDVTYIVPNPTTIPGPTVKRLVPISEETTTVDGGTTTKLVTTRQVEEAIVTQVTIFGPLSAALNDPDVGGGITGVLTPEIPQATSELWTVGVGGAEAIAVEGRDRVKFAQGDVVTFKNGHWYKVAQIPAAADQWWPVECELEVLRPNAIRGNQLAQGNRWSTQFAPSFLLEGNCLGEAALIIEQAAIPAGAPFGSAVWATIIEVPIQLTSAPTTHGYGVIVDRTGPAAFSGKVFTYGVETAFVPASGDLMIRARLTKFDIDPSVSDPRGALTVTLRGATDSVTEIPD